MSSIDSAVSSVSAAQQSAAQSQAAFAVAAKQLDATQQQGEAVVQLIDSAAQISKAVGKGHGFDSHA